MPASKLKLLLEKLMHGFIFVLLPYCWWTSCKLLKQELKWWKLISFFLCFSCVGAAAFPVQKKTKRAKTSNKQMERSFCFVYFHHPFFFSTTRWRWAASPNVAFFFLIMPCFLAEKKKRQQKQQVWVGFRSLFFVFDYRCECSKASFRDSWTCSSVLRQNFFFFTFFERSTELFWELTFQEKTL